MVADAGEPLGAMLGNHRRLGDEFVVVDTGAGAATEAAAKAGARVVSRAWDDDFAAARSAGLADATVLACLRRSYPAWQDLQGLAARLAGKD